MDVESEVLFVEVCERLCCRGLRSVIVSCIECIQLERLSNMYIEQLYTFTITDFTQKCWLIPNRHLCAGSLFLEAATCMLASSFKTG